MIIYNVTINIDIDVHEEWVQWMKEVHIPDVLATGMFLESRFTRVIGDEEGGKTYSIQYLCSSMDTYEKYQSEHAPRLQKEVAEKYPGKFSAFRTILNVVDINDRRSHQ
jgi:hypothetical protein